ncbi:uncharacterized protein LOC131343526 isoform X2 [Hemibagrus wyckioides]|uniref:uncharacterized protein LOC131343526 isoform X2 n=1 Tax=Hemibagrus wyckioides TaxID=337641 RepID=UPI00266B4D15|nr:uncharacterized protein LOC131343526 isoform X2 [Hemibagrus wyckioides]
MDLKNNFCRMKQISVLLKVLFFLTMSFPQVSEDTHSMQFLHTALTPAINFPEFTAVGLLDGEQFLYSDSNITKMEWIQKISADDPDNRKKQTHNMQSNQEKLKQLLVTLMKGQNAPQRMNCKPYGYGTTRGHDRIDYGEDDFVSVDLNSASVTETIEDFQAIYSQLKNNQVNVDVLKWDIIIASVAVLILIVFVCGFIIWMKKQKETYALTPGSPNASSKLYIPDF